MQANVEPVSEIVLDYCDEIDAIDGFLPFCLPSGPNTSHVEQCKVKRDNMVVNFSCNHSAVLRASGQWQLASRLG